MRILKLSDYSKAVIKVNKSGIKRFFGACKTSDQKEKKAAFLQLSKERLILLDSPRNKRYILSRWAHFYKNGCLSVDRNIHVLADRHRVYRNHLRKHIKRIFFPRLSSRFFLIQEKDSLSFFEKTIWERIFKPFFEKEPSLAIIKTDFKKLLKESVYLASQGGFANNVLMNESGVQDANAGDAAQFLFLGRAILAGLNCSNVDVRSSKYDAILDQDGELRRLQIKGLEGSSATFFTRPRGGRGVDSKHERNQQKRVTKLDCDFFIFVNKTNGTCYNIPIGFIDNLSEKKARACPLKELEDFRENWSFKTFRKP